MKTVFNFIIKHLPLIIGICLAIGLVMSVKTCNSYKNESSRRNGYITDYEEQLAGKEATIKQLQMTSNEISNSRDSINQKLIAATKELGIKEKRLKELGYIKDIIEFHDTINFHDTTFIGKDFDTTIVYNNYTKLGLSIRPPYQITFDPSITSEKYLIFSYKKEFVNTPSKIFFIRWFQKKRKVVTVDIKENNDLIKTEQTRFIDIVE